MLLWTCEAARECGLFDRIVVSTEDKEIAEIVHKADFEVDMRPPHLARYETSVAEICRELLDRFARQNDNFDILACLYATAPLRNAEDIRQTLALLDSCDVDFAQAVTEYGHSPYQALYADNQEFLIRIAPILYHCNNSLLPQPLVGNGSTYAAKVEAFRREGCFTGARLKGYRMPKLRSVDINTAEDYEFLKLCAQSLRFASGHCEG